MLIAIHPDKNGSWSYSEKWGEFLQKRNIKVKYINLNKNDAIKQVKDCDGVMWRWIHAHQDKIKAYLILHTIEYCLGIPVFPNHNTCWHYDNKIAQYYIFKALDIPIPDTCVFWDIESASDWVDRTVYPIIFKLSSGAGSSNVIKVNSRQQALLLIDKMFNTGVFPLTMNEFKKEVFPPKSIREIINTLSRLKYGLHFGLEGNYPPLPAAWWLPEKGYIYFQEFIPDNSFDTRITVIGDRAFGFRRFNRQDDFRASGSGNFDVDHKKIDPNCVKIAFGISKKLDCQSMAYDFIFKKGKPVVTEMSYTYEDWAVEKCPGHWKPDLTWVEGNMWPEEAQIEDFIDLLYQKKNQK
jgi:glutathione synthase/RimK-type ligase-like ATP-grasp enzyme